MSGAELAALLPIIGGAGAAGAGAAGAGSAAAGGMASLLGPSAFTAAMAGDAFMPAALGAAGTESAGLGSLLGSAAPGMMKSMPKAMASGLLGMQQQPGGAPMMPPPEQGKPAPSFASLMPRDEEEEKQKLMRILRGMQ
jgi:hypothetical protein